MPSSPLASAQALGRVDRPVFAANAVAPTAPSHLPPVGASPWQVRVWFDAAMDSEIPEADGTLATAQRTADVLARHAKADNTRRAYRAGVRAWCAWCVATASLPCLPAPADIAAFLAAERYRPPPKSGSRSTRSGCATPRSGYLHYLAGCPSPTDTAAVTETFAGIDRRPPSRAMARAQSSPRRSASCARSWRRSATTSAAARPGAAAGRLCRRVPPRRAGPDRGRASRGGRARAAHHPALLQGRPGEQGRARRHPLRHQRALPGARAAPLARRRRHHRGPAVPPHLVDAAAKASTTGLEPDPRGRHPAVDPGTIARIVKARGGAAGFDAKALGGHSLKRGAMNTAKDRRVHPAQLKQLGRHRSYATLAAYIEEGDLFEDNALNGLVAPAAPSACHRENRPDPGPGDRGCEEASARRRLGRWKPAIFVERRFFPPFSRFPASWFPDTSFLYHMCSQAVDAPKTALSRPVVPIDLPDRGLSVFRCFPLSGVPSQFAERYRAFLCLMIALLRQMLALARKRGFRLS